VIAGCALIFLVGVAKPPARPSGKISGSQINLVSFCAVLSRTFKHILRPGIPECAAGLEKGLANPWSSGNIISSLD
jgi:hypothetical protein